MTTITNKRLCEGILSTGSAVLYTAPSNAGNYAVVKSVSLCNTTASVVNVTLSFDGIYIVGTHALAAYDSIIIPFIDQILEAEEIIVGLAGSASAVNYYISGKEVT